MKSEKIAISCNTDKINYFWIGGKILTYRTNFYFIKMCQNRNPRNLFLVFSSHIFKNAIEADYIDMQFGCDNQHYVLYKFKPLKTPISICCNYFNSFFSDIYPEKIYFNFYTKEKAEILNCKFIDVI